MMQDMGYKPKQTDMPTEVKQESKIQYPRMCIDRNVPKELMDKEVGHTCRLEVIAKIVSKSIDEHGEDTNERVELEIHKLGYKMSGDKMPKDEYLSKPEAEREEYDREQMDIEDKKEKGEDKEKKEGGE